MSITVLDQNEVAAIVGGKLDEKTNSYISVAANYAGSAARYLMENAGYIGNVAGAIGGTVLGLHLTAARGLFVKGVVTMSLQAAGSYVGSLIGHTINLACANKKSEQN